MFLLSTVVVPAFSDCTLQVRSLSSEEFVSRLSEVEEGCNFCGHPVTDGVLRAAFPSLPTPERRFWDGSGIAIAARPRGGVRGAGSTGDTQVTLDDLEFCEFWLE